MVVSKFRVRSIFLILLISIGLIISSAVLVINYVPKSDVIGNILSIALGLVFLYIILQMVFGEIRSKAIKVDLLANNLKKISFLGLGLKTNLIIPILKVIKPQLFLQNQVIMNICI